MSTIKKIKCPNCGVVFTSRHGNTKYCGDICRKQAKRMMDIESALKRKESEKEERESLKKRKSNTTEINNVAVEARKHGMSYGQYVALHNI